MKRSFILTALLLDALAGACSPLPPSPGYPEATEALLKARAKQQTACKGKSQIDCTVYNASPSQVVKWLRTTGEPWRRTGPGWMNENRRSGRTTTVTALGGGSVVQASDVETAWERLEKRLSAVKPRPFPPVSCKTLGLGDSAYQVRECVWRREADRRDLSFRVTASRDRSLPPGLYRWEDGATCGYSLRGPEN